METLVNDPNRSVATLAVSTLLKTVDISRIDALLKQISSYMNEIDDEFKQVLVKSLLTLSVKFPEKHDVLLSFLSGILRNVHCWREVYLMDRKVQKHSRLPL